MKKPDAYGVLTSQLPNVIDLNKWSSESRTPPGQSDSRAQTLEYAVKLLPDKLELDLGIIPGILGCYSDFTSSDLSELNRVLKILLL